MLAPPGATFRSVMVGNGATVGVGDPVSKWIDCSDLFVDAPVSDAALPLIPIGSRADVILEGEGTGGMHASPSCAAPPRPWVLPTSPP